MVVRQAAAAEEALFFLPSHLLVEEAAVLEVALAQMEVLVAGLEKLPVLAVRATLPALPRHKAAMAVHTTAVVAALLKPAPMVMGQEERKQAKAVTAPHLLFLVRLFTTLVEEAGTQEQAAALQLLLQEAAAAGEILPLAEHQTEVVVVEQMVVLAAPVS